MAQRGIRRWRKTDRRRGALSYRAIEATLRRRPGIQLVAGAHVLLVGMSKNEISITIAGNEK